MDHYGIGEAVKGSARIYFQCSRGTGRTTSLIESVKDGDRVIFLNKQHSSTFKRRCLDRGVDVDCIVLPTDDPYRAFERGVSKGRTIFDHCWVEQFYMDGLESCSKTIDRIERETSGVGEANRETHMAAREACRWNF